MPAPGARAALAAAVLAAVAVPAPGAADGGRPGWVPDHAKLQLAGNVGFLSPGAGWALGRRSEADVFFGWVPEAVGGDDIFSVTGKLSWAPWRLGSRPWTVRPLTLALQLTYTFGDQYYLVPDHAFTPTALRSGVAVGAAVGRLIGKRSVSAYAELVAIDVGLVYLVSDRDVLGPQDVFSLAVGVRVEL
jgi:hypothetical protein